MVVGLVWDMKSLHFQVDGSWRRRLLRLLLGLLVVGVFYIGPKLLIDQLEVSYFLGEQALRFGRYALVGFAVSGIAPWLFQRLRLAQ
jgi:hypothetical protein